MRITSQRVRWQWGPGARGAAAQGALVCLAFVAAFAPRGLRASFLSGLNPKP